MEFPLLKFTKNFHFAFRNYLTLPSLVRTEPSFARTVTSLARTVPKPSDILTDGFKA